MRLDQSGLVVGGPQPTALAAWCLAWGWLSRLLAALRTRDEPHSRPGPNGRLRCGREARPKYPIPRRPKCPFPRLAQAEAAERLRLVRLEAEEELRWEIARATGGTQAETNTVEATAEAAAAVVTAVVAASKFLDQM